MSPKLILALLTLVAVVSDSMLHPFYPQYFAEVFGARDPRQVGLYIAASSLSVLLAFPLWARLSRAVDLRRLLIVTQLLAGALSIVCAGITSLPWFWLSSLSMLIFKASYLLIYPHMLALESKEQHVGTISLLAFVVYFGHILAALLSGAMFEWVAPRFLFLLMACGDALQLLLCLYWLRSTPRAALPSRAALPALAEAEALRAGMPRRFVHKLGAVMFLVYFSAYLTEPFFSSYWERLSGVGNRAITGTIFAIPGIAALLGLYLNTKARPQLSPYAGIVPGLVLSVGSLCLQGVELAPSVVIGRFLYGWALFQSIVRLDALLFQFSTPDTYAVDFSRIYLFQGLGGLFASLCAGSLASQWGARMTFFLSAGGFLASGVLYCTLFRKDWWPLAASQADPHPLPNEGVVS